MERYDMYSKIQKRTHEIISSAAAGDKISKAVDLFFIVLIMLNVVIVVADTFALPAAVRRIMSVVETISVIIFTIEYVIRLWVSVLDFPALSPVRARVKYVLSLQAIIDLVSLLPFYLPFLFPVNLIVLRVFRIFRLMRLFKVNRYTKALSSIAEVFKRKAHQLISSMLVVFMLMVIASVLMYNVEHDVQPEVFDNALSGLWWAVATLTTVGYGDIYPMTAAGRILSAIIALLGIGMVAVPTGIISAGFSEQIEKAEKSDEEKVFCPYCGKKIK